MIIYVFKTVYAALHTGNIVTVHGDLYKVPPIRSPQGGEWHRKKRETETER